jgi:hypothetical protein
VGVVDQAMLGTRDDVLIYTTESLTTEFALIGPVRVVFWARSSASTTQFSVTLAVARPDGAVLNFLDRMVRSTLREGSHGPAQPSEANAIYRYELELGDIALLVRPGMRLQLQIAASNYPRFAAGTVHDHQLSDLAAHVQMVYHNETHPSRLEVTTLPATALRSLSQ